MIKNPLQIILELLVLIIQSIVSTLALVLEKLVELFSSLAFMAGTGVVGLFIACVIGGIVVVLISKFVFKSTKSLFQVLMVYVIFVLILVLIFAMTAPISQTPGP